MRTFEWFDDWRNTVVNCDRCGWSGKLGDETFSEALEDACAYHTCPQCDRGIASIRFPTTAMIRAAAEQGNAEAIKTLPEAVRDDERWKKFEEQRKKPAAELPDIPGEKLEFSWDVFEEDGEVFAKVTCGDVLVLKELAWYEALWRFNEIKALLKEKYGTRFSKLVPITDEWLLGDSTSAEIDYT